MNEKIDLRKIMQSHQVKLECDLSDAELFDHTTPKGDVKEYDWCSFLRNFLPTRYQVSKAFVIDAEGSQSEQLDVVVHDRHYCPLFFEKGDSRYIPAESVYAVFDVKPELTRGDILYTGGKVESVRRLHVTSGHIIDRGEVKGPRKPFRVLGGILATQSSWSPPLGESLEKALNDIPDEGRLDLGCAIRGGAFEATYDPSFELSRSPSDVSLMFFIIRLIRGLQQLGTVPVIDLDAYSGWLEEEGRTG